MGPLLQKVMNVKLGTVGDENDVIAVLSSTGLEYHLLAQHCKHEKNVEEISIHKQCLSQELKKVRHMSHQAEKGETQYHKAETQYHKAETHVSPS